MSRTTQGRIEDMSVPEIIRLIGTKVPTCRASFRREEIQKVLFFSEGALVAARSNQVDDSLGQYLLTSNHISIRHYEAGSRHVCDSKRLGAALIECNAIKAEDLPNHLQDNGVHIALSLFGWTDGEFALQTNPAPEATDGVFPPVDWREIILQGIRRIDCWSRIIGGVGGISDNWYRSGPSLPDDLVRMNRVEKAVLELFESPATISGAMLAQAVSDFNLFRAFWALNLIGLMEEEAPAPVRAPVETPGAQDSDEPKWLANAEFGKREVLVSECDERSWFFPEILRRIRQERRTGRLDLETDETIMTFYFIDGDVAAVDKQADGDGNARPGCDRQDVLNLVWQATSCSGARSWFSEMRFDNGGDAVRCVDTRDLLIDSLDWVLNEEVLVGLLKETLGTLPVLPNPRHSASGYPIGRNEGFVLSLLDGKTTVDDVFLLSHLPERDTALTLYVLLASGLIEPQAAKYVSDQPGQSLLPQVQDELDNEEEVVKALMEFANYLDDFDHCAVLGVCPDASDAQIRKAAGKALMRFHPDKARAPKARLAFERITRAILESRNAMLQGERKKGKETNQPSGRETALANGAVEDRGPEDLERAPENIGETAETLYFQGECFRRQNELHNAVFCFKKAVLFSPDKARYRFALGRALAGQPKQRLQAEEQLLKAIELNCWDPRFHLELARLYRNGGRTTKACEVLKKALSVDPTNKQVQAELAALHKDQEPVSIWKRLGRRQKKAQANDTERSGKNLF